MQSTNGVAGGIRLSREKFAAASRTPNRGLVSQIDQKHAEIVRTPDSRNGALRRCGGWDRKSRHCLWRFFDGAAEGQLFKRGDRLLRITCAERFRHV